MNTITRTLTAIAFAASIATVAPAAEAFTNCNSFGGSTTCYGSDGSTYYGNSFGGNTNFYGTDSNGNSYSGNCSSFGGSTSCYSY